MKKVLILSIGFCSLVLFQACQKNKLNKETTTSQDNSVAETNFDDLFNVVNEAGKQNDLNGSSKMADSIVYTFNESCAIVTISPIEKTLPLDTFPKTLTIDFGTTGCVGRDGKTRKGKIIAVYTGRFNIAGTSITITTEGYFLNGNKINGTKTVINNGINAAGHTTYSVDVNGEVVLANNGGGTVSWTSSRVREWIEGEDTWLWDSNGQWIGLQGIFDDVWLVTGSGSGVNRDGRSFTVKITKGLRVQWCIIPEITEGTVEIKPQDLKLRTVDFGDKNCDRKATVTVKNGITKEINI